jgi:hypothetical protein
MSYSKKVIYGNTVFCITVSLDKNGIASNNWSGHEIIVNQGGTGNYYKKYSSNSEELEKTLKIAEFDITCYVNSVLNLNETEKLLLKLGYI